MSELGNDAERKRWAPHLSHACPRCGVVHLPWAPGDSRDMTPEELGRNWAVTKSTTEEPLTASQKDVDILVKAIADGTAAVKRVGRAFAVVAQYGPRMRMNSHGTVQTYCLAVYQRMIEEAWLGNGSRLECLHGELRIFGPDGERVDWATFARVWDAASMSMALLPSLIDYIAEVQRRHPELADVVADTRKIVEVRELLRGDRAAEPPVIIDDREGG